ncbi:MAG: hypothetical protein RLZZ373_2008 [Pseudomonadota bacterium]|jgi:hypothetical protein
MNYRLLTSLLLMAVLVGLYLWWSPPEEPATAPAPAASQGSGPEPGPLGKLKIF